MRLHGATSLSAADLIGLGVFETVIALECDYATHLKMAALRTPLLWTALDPASTELNERPKRIRKSHHKTRTGCSTCKVRRKKCDETKPSCYRCTSTGRQCSGYENNQSKSIATKSDPNLRSAVEPPSLEGRRSPSPLSSYSDTKHRPLQLWRPPKSVWFQTEQDYYCLDFFRRRTGPEIDAYFDMSFLLDPVLRACFSHPTVLQAAAAVGAAHRRFELGISPEAFRFCNIAAEQYSKTLRCLSQDLQRDDLSSAKPNMLVFVLLSLFETFQGNYDRVSTLMKAAIKQLLRPKLITVHSETHHKSAVVSYKTLRDFTDRTEQQAIEIFGSSTKILPCRSHSNQLTPIPKVFSSLEEARDVIITEGQYIWDAWHQLELGNLQDFSTQRLHVSRLLEWSRAYAEYAKSLQRHCRSDNRRSHLLKMYREALYLIILTQLASHKPDSHDSVPTCSENDDCTGHPSCQRRAERMKTLDAHFSRLLVVSEPLCNVDSVFAFHNHSIGFDTGIGPSLRLGAPTCRSTKVRYQVTSLLGHSDLQDQTCHTLGVYNIAEKLGSIVEHAMDDAGLDLVSSSKWVDITCFLDESRILLQYCREDEQGDLLFTQEWITY